MKKLSSIVRQEGKNLKEKNKRKTEFLVKKYGGRNEKPRYGMTEHEFKKYGRARIFMKQCDVTVKMGTN